MPSDLATSFKYTLQLVDEQFEKSDLENLFNKNIVLINQIKESIKYQNFKEIFGDNFIFNLDNNKLNNSINNEVKMIISLMQNLKEDEEL